MCAWFSLFCTASMWYSQSVCTITIADCLVGWPTKCLKYILALQVFMCLLCFEQIIIVHEMMFLKSLTCLQEVFNRLSLTSSIMCNVARNGSQMDSPGSRPYIINNHNALFRCHDKMKMAMGTTKIANMPIMIIFWSPVDTEANKIVLYHLQIIEEWTQAVPRSMQFVKTSLSPSKITT